MKHSHILQRQIFVNSKPTKLDICVTVRLAILIQAVRIYIL
jgi:hypothetical protein